MTLGLDIALIGRKEIPIDWEVSRPLSVSDLEELEKPRLNQKPKPLSAVKRLSERHRNLARVLAAGKPDWEAAVITGYTPSRISILKSDPAMQHLISHYQEDRDIAYQTVYEKAAAVSADVLDEISERLENPNDDTEFSNSQLIEVFKALADRSGNGPSSTVESNVNVNISDRLQAARKRALDARLLEARVIPNEQ
jgi:chromatin segregation and condensation protein Rec8/ScpA/Scc1 (kleisin family)